MAYSHLFEFLETAYFSFPPKNKIPLIKRSPSEPQNSKQNRHKRCIYENATH